VILLKGNLLVDCTYSNGLELAKSLVIGVVNQEFLNNKMPRLIVQMHMISTVLHPIQQKIVVLRCQFHSLFQLQT